MFQQITMAMMKTRSKDKDTAVRVKATTVAQEPQFKDVQPYSMVSTLLIE